MDVTITARHCTVADSVRQRATERVARLSKYQPRASAGDVIFDEDGSVRRAEIRIAVDGAPIRVAKADGETFQVALDRAVQKVARQLKREREKRVDHQAPTNKALDVEGGMATG